MQPDPVRQSLQAAVRGRLRAAAALTPDAAPRTSGVTDESAEAAWAALRKLGAPALEAPLAAGGMGLGLAASTAVAEELGRAALSGRYLAVAFAIDAATTGGAAESLVRELVRGDRLVTLAGFEGGFDDGGAPVRATADVSGGLYLTGRLPVDAPAGAPTGALLLPVALGPGRVGAVLLDLSTLDVEAVREHSGAGGLATLAGMRCADSAVLCTWDGGVLLAGVVGRARVRQAAYLLGLARGALATGVRYAADRRQFGQALREFQSVAFRLAAGYVQIEALRLAVARAAWLADSGEPYACPAAEVLAQAAETAAATAQMVLQVCGVRGMTGELRVHRHYLQIRREARRLGPPERLWRELGRDRLRALPTAG